MQVQSEVLAVFFAENVFVLGIRANFAAEDGGEDDEKSDSDEDHTDEANDSRPKLETPRGSEPTAEQLRPHVLDLIKGVIRVDDDDEKWPKLTRSTKCLFDRLGQEVAFQKVNINVRMYENYGPSNPLISPLLFLELRMFGTSADHLIVSTTLKRGPIVNRGSRFRGRWRESAPPWELTVVEAAMKAMIEDMRARPRFRGFTVEDLATIRSLFLVKSQP